ncbi:hypothetical protein Dda_5355 [Drechslerella dactyloides]|uniref:Uncharacterized protein n=1 Tax=Drechslerella dactyloides TaxID=74499 RepID=A0AAD6NIS7_DREDA|nr:hypothetical protein Dda_5355 [Drechslerella dactyloides]
MGCVAGHGAPTAAAAEALTMQQNTTSLPLSPHVPRLKMSAASPLATIKARKKRNVAIFAAHQVIKKSQYHEDPKRWHWALLDNIAENCSLPDANSPEFLEGLTRACDLAGAVWAKYYAPRGTKRKTPDDAEKGSATDNPTLAQMAAVGLSFKLDWNSMNNGVTVYRDLDLAEDSAVDKPDDEKQNIVLADVDNDKVDFKKEGENAPAPLPDIHIDADGNEYVEELNLKENERLIAKPSSVRAKFIERIMMSLEPQTNAGESA